MNRRSFFARVAGLFGLAAVAPKAEAKPATLTLDPRDGKWVDLTDCVHEITTMNYIDGQLVEHTYCFHFPAPVQVRADDAC